MFEQHRERNLSMVMDFYELTMSNGYFRDGVGNVRVAFDVFYRKNPDNGGFAIFAGLAQVAARTSPFCARRASLTRAFSII